MQRKLRSKNVAWVANRLPVAHDLRLARVLVSTLVISACLWLLLGPAVALGPQQAAAASDPVIAAAGDISCDPADASYNGGNGTSTHCHEKQTSDLLLNISPDTVLDLGDNQYYCGSLQAYQASYDPTWGRVKNITRPAAGNHEYLTSGGTGCDSTNAGAAGYFSYFGSAAGNSSQGYYSYDIGAWHIIALNTQCSAVGGCGSTSPQYKWLQADLAAHTNYCTLAYWHIPLFSSGTHAASNSKPFWNLLYANNADVILNGHDHIYERFAPQTPAGAADATRGIRQFTVGTGGNNHNSISSTIAANSEVRNATTFGVLKLTLHATSYDWQFVPEAGKTFTDSGTAPCHDASASTSTPTTAPTATPTSVGGSTATATFTPTPTPTTTGGQSVTVLPQADAQVQSANPSTNYGSSTALRVDASPIVNSYARFVVSGLNGASITRARLLFYMTSSSSSGIKALSVADNTWGEKTITYNNAPPMGSTIATVASVSASTWVSLDVSSYVQAEGTFSFGAITPGSTAISFASRESGDTSPELVLDLAGGGGSTATPTPTNTPTSVGPTATNTPTSTPTSSGPTPTNTPTATPTAGAAQSVTFLPGADAYVNASYPDTNYGTLTALRVDGSPVINSYVRFSVSGLNGAPITRARLLFYMNSSGSSGIKALSVADNTWGETSVTYNNAPALGSAVATSGGVTGGTWVTLDVTSYITGEGTYSFGVMTPGTTAISFASRESGANAPQLIIDLGP